MGTPFLPTIVGMTSGAHTRHPDFMTVPAVMNVSGALNQDAASHPDQWGQT